MNLTKKSLVCHREHIKYTEYKINKLLPVISCFSLWELMNNQ